ncbi:MAG: phosphohistidine phosphatase SixA, partial [Candidatus Hodarchaeota archaeon]
MPLLYLVQHGKAHPKEIDPKRPLTNEGKAETEKVAKQLADSNIVSVEKILHSGKERALETAKIFASFLNPSGGVHASENLAPLDDPSIWIKKLESIEKNTLIVGHL